MNKNRLEAFSDGVLAIIITIMVLEFKIPHGHSFQALEPLISVFISYFMSFVFVAIYWANHHHLLQGLKKVTSGIIWANMALLFWLSLIPFATGWMGENHFEANTMALYGAIIMLSGVSFSILQNQVVRNIPDNEKLKAGFDRMKRKGLFSSIAYPIGIICAYIHPLIPTLIFLGISGLWLIPDKNIEAAFQNQDFREDIES